MRRQTATARPAAPSEGSGDGKRAAKRIRIIVPTVTAAMAPSSSLSVATLAVKADPAGSCAKQIDPCVALQALPVTPADPAAAVRRALAELRAESPLAQDVTQTKAAAATRELREHRWRLCGEQRGSEAAAQGGPAGGAA